VSVAAGASGHLSIGEVLSHLHEEFPDVTVSKIRFLESQGLIDPERTPSGYRRFYGSDLERLRWILYQQREHFLPLRVIKERLDRFGGAGAPPVESSNGDHTPPIPTTLSVAPALVVEPLPAPTPAPRRGGELSLPLEGLEPESVDVAPATDATPQTAEITRAELLRATRLGDHALEELESFGIIAPIVGSGDAARYDEEGLETARAAAAFYAHGVAARHLRMYQHFAEREAELLSQVFLPYRRQRNPTSRARLVAELEQLARAGGRIRTLMLRRALRDALGE
jgi:DNA-binding transcriptional MerR regulator